MDNTKNNKRRDFFMNVCPTVAMAFLGITVLDSCSSGYDDDSDYELDRIIITVETVVVTIVLIKDIP